MTERDTLTDLLGIVIPDEQPSTSILTEMDGLEPCENFFLVDGEPRWPLRELWLGV